MKKLFAFLMVAIIVLSLSVPAFAATDSAEAPEEDSDETADLPEVVGGNVILVPVADILTTSPEEARALAETITEEFGEELTAEEVEAVTEVVTQAIESLASVVPEGVTVRSFCYAANAGEVTLKITDASAVTAMAFLNGEWVEIEVIDNGDGTYTLNLDEACPIAILTE